MGMRVMKAAGFIVLTPSNPESRTRGIRDGLAGGGDVDDEEAKVDMVDEVDFGVKDALKEGRAV
jgi:hypothetical protein